MLFRQKFKEYATKICYSSIPGILFGGRVTGSTTVFSIFSDLIHLLPLQINPFLIPYLPLSSYCGRLQI